MRETTLVASTMAVEVTNLCNLNCIMCFKRGLPKQSCKHMSLNLFIKAIEDVRPKDNVVFVGLGEPLLNPAFFYMLLEARKRGLGTNMVTNGIFMDKVWAKVLVKMGIGKISVSLDAATKGTYDKIRKGGDFNKVIENIKTIVEEKRKQGVKYPYIRLDMVGMKCNIHELVKFVQLAKKLGVDGVTMLHLEPTTKELEKQHLCNMPKREVNVYYNKALAEAKKLDIGIVIRPLKPVCNMCNSMWQTPYIDSNGNVSICCLTGATKDKSVEYFKDTTIEMDPSKLLFGNLYEQSFKDIWNSEKIEEFREKYNKIFTLDKKKKWSMKSYLKLRKDNKVPHSYCLVCARRFNLIC